ncbi:VOC family protein [Flavobacterium hiemivividum]|uniref:VOC family protein n=1 Tax=Flavobacterium hiemivividum TaxID=2541734 RepID=A0A4R5D083_9FLAO|nr:VOC family protein [Flavobacterium hiemivividum]TDE06589.1 VOC family protein [Flavobacterium hiemivividum]
MNTKRPIVWFEIYVDDIERAAKFYETIFDVTLEGLPNPTEDELQMMTFPGDMNAYGANGALVKAQDVKAGGNSTLVYFGSADCVTEELRIEKAGGKIFRPKMAIGEYGFITLFIDTEGNMIGLHSME